VNSGQVLILPSGVIHFGFNSVLTASYSVNFADCSWAKNLPQWVRQKEIEYPEEEPLFEVDASSCDACKGQFKSMHCNLGLGALSGEKILSEV
jgi:hypothetical protein